MKRGVTIIELGIVIICITAAVILLYPFVKKLKEEVLRIRCINNLQRISIALREYALENDEKLPADLSLIYVKGYIRDGSIFDCPFSEKKGDAKEPDYEYVKGLDFKSTQNYPIVYDKKGNHKNNIMYVLYISGEILEEAESPI